MIAVPCAIVNETHLCLIPSLDGNSYGELKNGGSRGNGRKNYSDGESHSSDKVYTFPAIPLSFIYKICGSEYISCSVSDDADEVDADAYISDGSLDEVTGSSIETIRLFASDIAQSSHRFIHPVSLLKDGASVSSTPMRVSSDPQISEGKISWSRMDGEHASYYLDVGLPQFTTDVTSLSSVDDEGSDRNFYGDQSCNFFGDKEVLNSDNSVDSENRNLNNKLPNFEVQGAGSCLLADFLGVGGYQQALVLPRINPSLISFIRNPDSSANEQDFVQQAKKLLLTILANSFITDGAGILISQQLRQTSMLNKVNGILTFKIPPLEMNDGLIGEIKSPTESPSKKRKRKEKLQENQEPTSNNAKANLFTDFHPPDKDLNQNCAEEKNLPWLDAIRETIEDRLANEIAESKQLEKTLQVRRDLISQGVKTLRKASRCNFGDSTNMATLEDTRDAEVVRLRYGTRPRTSVDAGGGTSVVMDLELDVQMHGSHYDNLPLPTANKLPRKTSPRPNVWHDFHISCSYAHNIQSSSPNSPTATSESIRTISAVVPILQTGDCITILASIFLNNLEMNFLESNGQSTVDLSIQGLCVDGSSGDEMAKRNPIEKQQRQGMVLCILRLPVELLLLSPPSSLSAPRSGHWVQQEIDFTSDNHDSRTQFVPTAIFDHRSPRTIVIDTSSGANSLRDASMWKKLVSTLNDHIGGNSYIDLFCRKGDPRLKLVVFGSNPEERAG